MHFLGLRNEACSVSVPGLAAKFVNKKINKQIMV